MPIWSLTSPLDLTWSHLASLDFHLARSSLNGEHSNRPQQRHGKAVHRSECTGEFERLVAAASDASRARAHLKPLCDSLWCFSWILFGFLSNSLGFSLGSLGSSWFLSCIHLVPNYWLPSGSKYLANTRKCNLRTQWVERISTASAAVQACIKEEAEGSGAIGFECSLESAG